MTVTADQLLNEVEDLREVNLSGDAEAVKYLSYASDEPVYLFINEGRETYQGTIALPV